MACATVGGRWEEPVQVDDQEYALWLAGIIHKETKGILKVVRYGLTISAFPNRDTVERYERFCQN